MMKTIREFLEEQINEQLIQAVVSGRRTGEGPSKVKLRPVELKGQIFYQASMTEAGFVGDHEREVEALGILTEARVHAGRAEPARRRHAALGGMRCSDRLVGHSGFFLLRLVRL